MSLLQRVLSTGLLVLLVTEFGSSTTLTVNNGGQWGDWGDVQFCPPGFHAYGFSLKVEGKQGGGDDTALNGIKLYCRDQDSRSTSTSVASAMRWGAWTSAQFCPGSARLTSFQLRVERPQGIGDDTAANNVRFRCSDGTVLEGHGLSWGDWGSWSSECPRGICSMRAKLEWPQCIEDDTALNDVQMFCCAPGQIAIFVRSLCVTESQCDMELLGTVMLHSVLEN
ncbi:vitelline membrane outer layer protein 1-like [Engraulis encrasicolus]|uniref:vitelline membrane outer layer protein 1-like n=1 Tax=Engraulis encrasicolus TaxID=184585 RepID=UPI002FD4E8C9